jgi:hypothetical protein
VRLSFSSDVSMSVRLFSINEFFFVYIKVKIVKGSYKMFVKGLKHMLFKIVLNSISVH